jgi:hypothetical protein
MFVIGTFSCGSFKTGKSYALMEKKIEDSLEIVVQTGKCISLKEENVLSFHLKNNSHSSLTINAGNIAPGSISDSVGHNLPLIKRIEYATRVNDPITLGAGAEKEIAYETSYFSNYDLKKGLPYYVCGFYISTRNTNVGSKRPSTKFYLCDQ